jgi:hypothetical protein
MGSVHFFYLDTINLVRYYLYLIPIHNLNFSIIKNKDGTTNKVKNVAINKPDITVVASGPQKKKLSPPHQMLGLKLLNKV